MKVLASPAATAEQLRIISDTRAGTEVIRGAAGSGKTSTALLRLRNLTDMFRSMHNRTGNTAPVKALVLTYNRTLCGYVEALALEQASQRGGVSIEVATYAQWATNLLGHPKINGSKNGLVAIARKHGVNFSHDFLTDEVEYIMGRLIPNDYQRYLDIERTGRGIAPRVDKTIRQQLILTINEYREQNHKTGMIDWEDLPIAVQTLAPMNYEIVVIDEAQDFSANQLRSIVAHLANPSALTLVLDTAQRLYPRGYTWTEVGVQQPRYYRLEQNHRNTVEIAAFARGILDGVAVDDDGTIPDLTRATRHGELPQVLRGLYSAQLDFTIDYIRANVDLKSETIAFLHPKAGSYFGFLRNRLRAEGLPFHEITRERDWPADDVNIVLSTMHSAKGLEFDHVFILGLNGAVTPHGEDIEDGQLALLRRLFAMAVARARRSVVVGYKPTEASTLIEYFQPDTFEARNVP